MQKIYFMSLQINVVFLSLRTQLLSLWLFVVLYFSLKYICIYFVRFFKNLLFLSTSTLRKTVISFPFYELFLFEMR